MNNEILDMDLFGLLEAVARSRNAVTASVRCRDDAILVDVVVPGQRWEIEFLLDEEPAVEVFKSDGKILDAAALSQP